MQQVGQLRAELRGCALTIDKAALAISIGDASKVYDGDACSGGNGVRYSGFVAGEGVLKLDGMLVYGDSSQGAVRAGSYAITPSGLTAGNYDIGDVDGTLRIAGQAEPATLVPEVTRNWLGSQPQSRAQSGDDGEARSAQACEGARNDTPHLCLASDYIRIN